MNCAGMDPRRNAIADAELIAGVIEIRKSPIHRDAWAAELQRCLNVWIDRLEAERSTAMKEIAVLRSSVAELRLMVGALEERLDRRSA